MSKTDERKRSIPVEISRDKVLVRENVSYETAILPESPNELGRDVEIREEAEIEGDVFGRSVDIGSNCKIEGDICAKKDIIIGEGSVLSGNLLCEGKIVLYDKVDISKEPVNIVGKKVGISDGCEISGNVFAQDIVSIRDDCSISGIVVCTKGDIEVGNGVQCADIICEGSLKVKEGVKIKDNLIRSGDVLTYNDVELADFIPEEINHREGRYVELNLNTNRADLTKKVGYIPKVRSDFLDSKKLRRVLDNYDLERVYEQDQSSKSLYHESLNLYKNLIKADDLERFDERFKEEFFMEIEDNKDKSMEGEKLYRPDVRPSEGPITIPTPQEDNDGSEHSEEPKNNEGADGEDELVVFTCPECEGEVSEESVECPVCRTVFEDERDREKSLQELEQLMGVSAERAEKLYEHGFRSIHDLKDASKEDILEIEGIGVIISEIIMRSVREIEEKE